MSALTSLQRETRNEGRIAEIKKFCRAPKFREEIINHFSPRWGVGETTIAQVIQSALRQQKITYTGVYKAK